MPKPLIFVLLRKFQGDEQQGITAKGIRSLTDHYG